MSELLRAALAQSTPEERARVLAELAKDALRSGGRGPIPLRDESAKTIGYLTPTDGLAALVPQEAGWVAEMRSRVATPGVTHSPEDFLAALNRAAQTTK